MNEDRFERIARAFVDGYNARDPEAWAAIFHPDCEYRPTVLVGDRSPCRGREQIRAYIRQLAAEDRGQQAVFLSVRGCSENLFIMSGEVHIEGENVSDATVIFTLRDGLIIHGHAHLTDVETLDRLGLLPAADDRHHLGERAK